MSVLIVALSARLSWLLVSPILFFIRVLDYVDFISISIAR